MDCRSQEAMARRKRKRKSQGEDENATQHKWKDEYATLLELVIDGQLRQKMFPEEAPAHPEGFDCRFCNSAADEPVSPNFKFASAYFFRRARRFS